MFLDPIINIINDLPLYKFLRHYVRQIFNKSKRQFIEKRLNSLCSRFWGSTNLKQTNKNIYSSAFSDDENEINSEEF